MVNETVMHNARILIVDDEEGNVRLLERLFQRAGYRYLQTTTDGRDALAYYHNFQPDLIMLDLMLPYLSGYEIMQQLQSVLPKDTYLPILVLTADAMPGARQRALAAGAKDILIKPFDLGEALVRVKNLLEVRRLYLQIQKQDQVVEERIQQHTRYLEEEKLDILKRLAWVAEFRDDISSTHPQRVGVLSAQIARILGWPRDQVKLIRFAAPLHDIGKIGISDHILLKPGKLTEEEFEQVQPHTTIGARILMGSRFPLLQMAEEIVLSHHENWDGAGYPLQLRGEDIPLSGRIVAVADTFDTMVGPRVYRQALSATHAHDYITQQSGKRFDPGVVEAFLRIYRYTQGEISELNEEW